MFQLQFFFLLSLTLSNLTLAHPTSYKDFQSEVAERIKKRLLINPLNSPISVAGAHKFVAPSIAAGDQRGPCPGLNALANHGYIPHNGVASLVDIVAGVNEVYGMGVDLGTILAVMGTVFSGNPLSLNPGFSIGGTTSKSTNLLGNLLGLVGTPRGLEGSHNFIEADGSNTRNDLYQTGDAWTMNMTLFYSAYNSISPSGLTFDEMGQRCADRWHASKETNPTFWYGPYTGMIVRNAGYAFAARLMSNHTVEKPEGVLTRDVFASFFGVSGGQYKYGWERIPENWYKIPVDYSLPTLNLDLIAWMTKYPELASIGGNTGKVNSFTGLDTSDITGGLLNTATLLEGNNLMCFVLNTVATFSPNSLSGIFKTLAVPLEFLLGILKVPLLDLACPATADLKVGGKSLWDSALEQFPGAKRAKSAL